MTKFKSMEQARKEFWEAQQNLTLAQKKKGVSENEISDLQKKKDYKTLVLSFLERYWEQWETENTSNTGGKSKERAQAEFVFQLMSKLFSDIRKHETNRQNDRLQYHSYRTGCPKKEQIQSDIRKIRRELLELSAMFEDWK